MLISTVIGEPPLANKTAYLMSIGELGRIVSGPDKGELVLRAYETLFSLNDPSKVWDENSCCGDWPEVAPIPNATVTLTFGSGS